MHTDTQGTRKIPSQACNQSYLCLFLNYPCVIIDPNSQDTNHFRPASVSKYALSQTITHLTTIFRNPDETLTRTATLTLLGEIISATRNNSSTPVIGGASPKPALAPYKDDILAVLVAGLKVPAAYQPALKGLRVIIDIPNLLADEEVGFVVHNANELLRTTRDEDELAW